MNAFLLELFNMSLVASVLIVAVVLLRLVFKKAPKAIICVLWALVGLRLICPFSFESKLSLVPDAEPVEHISQFDSSELTEKPVYKDVVSFEASDGSVIVKTEDTTEFDFAGFLIKLAPYIWVGGILIMAVSSVISYIRLRRSMLICVNKEGNIWLCDSIKSPFILGVIKPKIYIPSHLNEEEQEVVIAHEKAHLKRLDHLWKPLGYFILTIHWFNPLVWVSYALLCRDIEGACDERVVKDMNIESKKLYSETLLTCSAPRHILTACPVAFGEISVKGRVKSVLSYKKPAFWIIILAVVATVAVAVFFMTNPVEKKISGFKSPEELIHKVIMDEEKSLYPEKDSFACESHYVFDTQELGRESVYYMWVAYMEYTLEDGELQSGGGVGPKMITMAQTEDGTYELMEYWEPTDGEGYGDSIRERFPAHLHDRVFYGTTQDCALEETNKLAAEHFGVEPETQNLEQYPRFTGEILEVKDKHYLIAPTDGEVIMGLKCEKVYVAHGGEVLFEEGDLVTVSHNNIIEDSLPPILPSVNHISLMVENFRRPAPASVEFYRAFTDDGETFASAVVDVTDEKLKDIEVYRYSPESLWVERSTAVEGGMHVYHERFSPYLYIDKGEGLAHFAYSDGCNVTGRFKVEDNKLTINYLDYYTYINNLGRSNLVFDITDDGYVLNKSESVIHVKLFYEIDGMMCDDLPNGAVFKNDFDLEVK